MPSAIENQTSCPAPDQKLDNAFHQLVKNLNALLSRSLGSDFTDIDPGPLVKLMEDYHSDDSDWSRYAYGNEKQCFTRNLIDGGNGKHNLVGPDGRAGDMNIVLTTSCSSS